ncbi:MAG: hypothetical protein WCP10_09110 [Desulfuromonadales bacterium]
MRYSPHLVHRLFSLVVGISSVFILCSPPDVSAGLQASAEVKYDNYDAKNNENIHISSHSLAHKYSLMYNKHDEIISKRFGYYNISIGYEWGAFTTSTSSNVGGYEDVRQTRGHIKFSGDVEINPRELPLRLTLYSRDMNALQFATVNSIVSDRNFTNGSSNFSNPAMVSGINGGVNIESGATLIFGVKNGMTNGYVEVLRHIPMLLVDFKDNIVKDYQSDAPVDNRLTRLAFVSLNKKDNWFHYSVTQFTDHINPSQNYKETQYRLGMIDHMQQRRWVDFSNWISVSTDASYTKTISTDNLKESANVFDFNLFASARRSTWDASAYNNINRTMNDSGRLSYRTTVPLYISGTFSPDSSWSTRLNYASAVQRTTTSVSKFDDMLVSYSIETFKRALFRLTQTLSFESATLDSKRNIYLRGGLESSSSSKFSRDLSIASSYFITYTNSSADYGGDNRQLSHNLTLSANYRSSNTLYFQYKQTAELTNGYAAALRSGFSDVTVLTPQAGSLTNGDALKEHTFRTTSSLSAGWNPSPRLTSTISGDFDYSSSSHTSASTKATLSQKVGYNTPIFKADLANSFSYEKGEDNAEVTRSYAGGASISYTATRQLTGSLAGSYARTFSRNPTEDYSFNEAISYSMRKSSGVSGRLFDINQSASYRATLSSITSTSVRPRETKFTLGVKYYPFRQLTLGAGGAYTFYSKYESSLSYYGQLAIDFRLLQASIDYTVGTRKSDGYLEKRLTATVKKQF